MDLNNLGKITKQLLKTRSGEFDLESIHSLVLRKNDIDDLGCVGECTSLERLDLSYNDVTRLYSLAGLTNLIHLNLSANRISSLEGLQSLDNLRFLNLAGNLIGSADTLRCLSTLEKFEELRLKELPHNLSNPICMNNTYKQDVLSTLPDLKTLDGERLIGKGSELFTMCSQLDRLIEAKQKASENSNTVAEASSWISEDFWENKTAKQFELSSLGDAEQQLKDLLADCERVSKSASNKLKVVAPSTNTENSDTVQL